MSVVYNSIQYDLSLFGIEKIKSAILASDKDSGVSIEVSFDGGSTFHAPNINEKFEVDALSSLIKVRITFNEQYKEPYTIETTGNYPMLAIGTSLFFSTRAGQKYETTIGPDGAYSINLPDTGFKVWFIDEVDREMVLDMWMMPRYRTDKTEPKAKEAIVELFARDIPWAKYTVFDVYENLDKVATNTARLDIYGNLIDFETNKVCRWWALGFTDE